MPMIDCLILPGALSAIPVQEQIENEPEVRSFLPIRILDLDTIGIHGL